MRVGTKRAEQDQPDQSHASARQSANAWRAASDHRLFCDVVNSTGLAEKLDPEDWTDLMNALSSA